MSKEWIDVKENPTLYENALSDDEGGGFDWHDYADSPHSSQVFCVSTFGTLRFLRCKDRVLDHLCSNTGVLSAECCGSEWSVSLECQQPDLLGEYGGKPTSIDVLCESDDAVVCIEAKFKSDAQSGFGGCSQPDNGHCSGVHGPGSDLKTGTDAPCRLQVQDKDRSPRLYWSLGCDYFKPNVVGENAIGKPCPFAGPAFQLMRNFLFAAACAQSNGKQHFGVLAIVPRAVSRRIAQQIDDFRDNVLLEQHRHRIQLAFYDDLIELLRESKNEDANALGDFLDERMHALGVADTG